MTKNLISAAIYCNLLIVRQWLCFWATLYI